MKPKKTFILEARAMIRAEDRMSATKKAVMMMRKIDEKHPFKFYAYSVKESE